MLTPESIFLFLYLCFMCLPIYIIYKEEYKRHKEREEKEKKWETERQELIKAIREGRVKEW